MKITLPETILSDQDLKALAADVKSYARWFSQAAAKQKAGAGHASEPPAIPPAVVSVIRDWSGSKVTQQSLDTLITALEDFEKIAPRITITLAAPASNSTKKTLSLWCRKHIDPAILVSFQFNSALLGGMVVRYGSRIFDWSFRREILAARAKFPEVLRRV